MSNIAVEILKRAEPVDYRQEFIDRARGARTRIVEAGRMFQSQRTAAERRAETDRIAIEREAERARLARILPKVVKLVDWAAHRVPTETEIDCLRAIFKAGREFDYTQRPEKTRSTAETARDLLALICEKHNLSSIDLRSERRTANVVVARHELMYRLRKETTWSLPRIGNFLGGRDHTTVLHGVRKHESRVNGST